MTNHITQGIGSPKEVYDRMHGATGHEIPPIGSIWFNNHREKFYTVAGLVASCEDEGAETWEVLYRSDDMPEGHYRRRSIESWYGNNRHGQPRFVRQDEQVS